MSREDVAKATAIVVARLGEAAAAADVFAFVYPTLDEARAVWERNRRLMEKRIADGKGDRGGSMWTAFQEGAGGYAVLVVDIRVGMRDVGWGGGQPLELDEQTRASLIERHLAQLLAHVDAGGASSSVNRFGRNGAELLRGGAVAVRVSGGPES